MGHGYDVSPEPAIDARGKVPSVNAPDQISLLHAKYICMLYS